MTLLGITTKIGRSHFAVMLANTLAVKSAPVNSGRPSSVNNELKSGTYLVDTPTDLPIHVRSLDQAVGNQKQSETEREGHPFHIVRSPRPTWP